MFDFQKIEKKWQKIWRDKRIYEPNLKGAKKPFYNLMMFPYPSAEGLHVGNMYAFTGSDIYGRFKRMQGADVFEPMGLDGFGIHSENYALKIGAHPMEQAKISEKRFYKQLEMIGNGFSWKNHLETYDVQYYKWTQWIFIQLFKNGLAYRKKQAVNWCPSCKTVLADEQVISGKCERCNTVVIKKELEQWFFKITKYAERLLKNLDKIDWSEKVKIAQKEWIGKSEGAEIEFSIKGAKEKIKIFTTRPDTLFGATYMVLAPENPLIKDLEFRIKNLLEVKKYIEKTKRKSEGERIAEGKEKTGVELKGIKAINPANKKQIPIFVADYVLSTYGTGAIMAVPAHDERDAEFARKFNLEFSDAPLVDADEIVRKIDGKKQVQYHLRDWLISRQRYWGAPIPMIYCEKCAAQNKGGKKDMPGWYAVPENKLPVKLPFVKEFRPKGKGESPLATIKSFYEVKCPHCGAKARRETDVSDTFLDSAWYYLGYIILGNQKSKIKNQKFTFDNNLVKKWLPVNMYIGGAEHSVLHLLYSRFLTMAFYDLKLLHFEEPFTKFRAHGLLIKEGGKMSKSKGNVINPDDYIKKFGADTIRMYLMFLAPFEQGGDFRDAGLMGIVRFLQRIWRLGENKNYTKRGWGARELMLNRSIMKITSDIEKLNYNTAISQLMILLRVLEEYPDKSSFEQFLKLLAPFAPFITEEIWQQTRINTDKNTDKRGCIRINPCSHPCKSVFKSIHKESWPVYNKEKVKEDKFELVIQINGKIRDKVLAETNISQAEAEKLVLSREKIIKLMSGQKIKKIIFVPNRLINIVI